MSNIIEKVVAGLIVAAVVWGARAWSRLHPKEPTTRRTGRAETMAAVTQLSLFRAQVGERVRRKARRLVVEDRRHKQRVKPQFLLRARHAVQPREAEAQAEPLERAWNLAGCRGRPLVPLTSWCGGGMGQVGSPQFSVQVVKVSGCNRQRNLSDLSHFLQLHAKFHFPQILVDDCTG